MFSAQPVELVWEPDESVTFDPSRAPQYNIVGVPITPTQDASTVHTEHPLIRRGPFLGVVLLLALIGFAIWSSQPDGPAATSSVADSQNTATEAVYHKMQETFRVGYWQYQVNGSRFTSVIYDLPERLHQADSGNWVVVDLTVWNLDKSSSTRPVVVLVDPYGREFSESTVWSNGNWMQQEPLEQLRQLNPGVGKRGALFFDAPVGSYRLKVSGGYESGEHALVTLGVR